MYTYPMFFQIDHIDRYPELLASSCTSLVIVHESNTNLTLSIRNIPNVQLLYANTVNLRDLLLAKHILITEKALTHISQFNE